MPLIEEYKLAPTLELVRYLAIFRRSLWAIVDYTERGDKPGMLLGGWLTDALHNVPSLLWNYSEDSWHTPKEMDAWMKHFPDYIEKRGAPYRLIEDSKHIFSEIGTARELGLQGDLSDVDLAPLPKIHGYLDLLYRACLDMRLMRNYGDRSRNAWNRLEYIWTDEADRMAIFNKTIASLLLPVPSGLMKWNAFDEEQFSQSVRDTANQSGEDRQWWLRFLRPQSDDDTMYL